VSSFLQLISLLIIILLAAKTAGYISTRLGQPSVFGELLVGVILGPSLLNILNLPWIDNAHLGDFIYELGEIGVLLLMFLAGLELHFRDLAKNFRVSLAAGVLGVLVPVGFGFLVGEILGYDLVHSLFLGLTLGATSVSISAQTLIEMGKLRTRIGLGLLGAAVFDDILVILLLSISLGLFSGSEGLGPILIVIGRMALFLALASAFGYWFLPKLVKRVSKLPISFGAVTFAVIIMLVFGLASEVVGGMAAITGTFLAGLMFSRTPQKADIEQSIQSIAYSFFVPIFFVNIGLIINLRELDAGILIAVLLISVAAVLGKVIGAGLGAKIGKYSWKEALAVGIGMISRGEVGLIVAKVELDQDLLSPEIFSAIIGMVLVTTLITPPLLRISLKEHPKPDVEDQTTPKSTSEEAV